MSFAHSYHYDAALGVWTLSSDVDETDKTSSNTVDHEAEERNKHK